MQYTDPATGKKKTRSAGTAVRRDAERAAAKWETELREGRFAHADKTSWPDFRDRYEREVLSGLADATFEKASVVFNAVERILSPAKVRNVTTERISHFQSQLREAGKSESTIAGMLAYVRAALKWAHAMGMIPALPKIERPKRAKGGKVMKGRPITGEEFDRMLDKVEAGLLALTEKAAERDRKRLRPSKRPLSANMRESLRLGRLDSIQAAVPAWQRYLRGLWLSGLRLEESTELYWDRDDKLCVVLSGRRPMLRIPAELEKGNKDRLLPMAPEFAEFLQATPEAERTGRVFVLPGRLPGTTVSAYRIGETVCAIGRAAGIKVNTDPKTGKVKYASAHDLRRSFGERWAARVMPQVLMELMRHESIDTTMKFYVGRNAEKTADALWAAHEAANGNTGGNSGRNATQNASNGSSATGVRA
jgi:integrase